MFGYLSIVIEERLGIGGRFDDSPIDIPSVACVMFILVLVLASQDIAVDAWSILLLSPQRQAWASMAQTIGMVICCLMSTLRSALSSRLSRDHIRVLAIFWAIQSYWHY
jgi:hypothetical protein